MKMSDCCGASPDGIDGAEETGICPDCMEPCEWIDDEEEEKTPKAEPAPFRSLGYGNGWPASTMPEELRHCQDLGHQMLESKMPCGDWLARCPICRIEYMYDSSG